MKEGPKKEDKLVPISEAARILGVSIATVRRWDKRGILHAVRRSDRYRYFSVEELERVKFAKPLTISEAAHQLGLSATTLRRVEEQGIIKPERNEQGERLYTENVLSDFLNSEYYLSRKKVQEKVLEPFRTDDNEKKEDEEGVREDGVHQEVTKDVRKDREAEAEHVILQTVAVRNQKHVSSLLKFKRAFYGSGIFLLTAVILIVAVITTLFVLYPEGTSNYFDGRYRNSIPPYVYLNGSSADGELGISQVLGVVDGESDSSNDGAFLLANSRGSTLGRVLRPFSRLALPIVKVVDEEAYNKAISYRIIRDENDIFTLSADDAIIPLLRFELPASSYFTVPDSALINL